MPPQGRGPATRCPHCPLVFDFHWKRATPSANASKPPLSCKCKRNKANRQAALHFHRASVRIRAQTPEHQAPRISYLASNARVVFKSAARERSSESRVGDESRTPQRSWRESTESVPERMLRELPLERGCGPLFSLAHAFSRRLKRKRRR